MRKLVAIALGGLLLVLFGIAWIATDARDRVAAVPDAITVDLSPPDTSSGDGVVLFGSYLLVTENGRVTDEQLQDYVDVLVLPEVENQLTQLTLRTGNKAPDVVIRAYENDVRVVLKHPEDVRIVWGSMGPDWIPRPIALPVFLGFAVLIAALFALLARWNRRVVPTRFPQADVIKLTKPAQ